MRSCWMKNTMSSLNLTDVRETLDSREFLTRMQSAFQQPLGGDITARQTPAIVTGHDTENVHFRNLETEQPFTMPLSIFQLVPAVGLPVEISRVYHRIFCWPNKHRTKDMAVELQIQL